MDRLIRRIIVALFAALFLPQCNTSQSTNAFENSKTYFTTMQNLHIEVAYETGAEPYAGNVGAQPLWNFLKSNLDALFVGRPLIPTISTPTALDQMKQLPAQGKSAWTTQDILDLANAQRQGVSSATESYFYLLFLNGYFADESGKTNPQVLGLSISGTTVIAIFKPVITAASSGQPPFVAKYIEQSTLVHEMGHALGLVNNGLPLTAQHQDSVHGAHCGSTACTMYWQNEGPAAARQFVLRYVLTGNEVIFGSECLNDARSYR